MSIQTGEDFYNKIDGKWIILDTNVFIDLLISTQKTNFANFLQNIKEKEIPLVTIYPVIAEFLKGAQSIQKYNDRQKVFESIVGKSNILPFTPDIPNHLFEIIKSMGIDGASSSITDLMLGAYLRKYKEKLCLLTKDIKDFPTHVYNRINHINIMFPKAIHSYGLYCYSK